MGPDSCPECGGTGQYCMYDTCPDCGSRYRYCSCGEKWGEWE